MENIEIINLWKQYDEKLEKSISLNHKVIEELQQQKAKNVLRSTKNIKWFAVMVGIIYIGVLAYLVLNSLSFANIFFVSSLSISMLITIVAVAYYIYQIKLINEIDNSESVVQIQQKLAALQASTLKTAGILLLQLPFYSTWYINFEWIRESPKLFYFVHVPIVLLFAMAGIWLFKNINVKNMDKKWFRFLFQGREWLAILKSGQFLKEIESFKHN
jgi:hypothetical protein